MAFRGAGSAALAGAKSLIVEMCASDDKVIGERRTVGSLVGSVSICAS